jgi:hypothetical protein
MTFADVVYNLIWYINTFVIPLIFLLAFVAFLWGIFLYMFYQQSIEEARNIILHGVVVLAIMVSIWGILAVLRNSFTSGGGLSGSSSYPTDGSLLITEESGSMWDDVSGFFSSSDEPEFTECGPGCATFE